MGMTRSDQCRKWTRRAGFKIAEPLANGYRFGEALKFFEKRIPCAPEAAPGLKKIAANRLQWLNAQMTDGREYLCGKRFTLADILLYCWLDFGNQVGQPLDPANSSESANGRRLRPRRLHRHCAVRLRRSKSIAFQRCWMGSLRPP